MSESPTNDSGFRPILSEEKGKNSLSNDPNEKGRREAGKEPPEKIAGTFENEEKKRRPLLERCFVALRQKP